MKWHHSLYSRIAVGFVACLALLLLVQAVLFVWVVSRSAQTIPNQPPDRFAQTVALDVTQAIERDASLDVAQYIRQEYARDAQPFFVLLRDGRAIEIGGTFPQRMIEDARARFQVLLQRPFDGNPDAPGRRFGMPGRSSERGGAELFGRGSSG